MLVLQSWQNMKIICPNCKGTSSDKWGKVVFENKAYPNESSLYECLRCGLYFIYPYPDEKLLAKIYSAIYHYNPNLIRDFFVKTYMFLLDYREDLKLIKFYKKRGKVLDIGAGRGDFISLLPSNIYERWVYDPYLSKEDLKTLANKVGKINNYSNLSDYPNGYFDVIILRNVIEHTTSFQILVKNIYKKLKRGGILFIRTPNINSADFKIFRTNWYEVKMPGHMVFFNTESMRNVLTANKFRILHNEASKRSMPFSFFRSVTAKMHRLFKFMLSLVFSFLSPLIGEGGELLTVARK